VGFGIEVFERHPFDFFRNIFPEIIGDLHRDTGHNIARIKLKMALSTYKPSKIIAMRPIYWKSTDAPGTCMTWLRYPEKFGGGIPSIFGPTIIKNVLATAKMNTSASETR